MSSVELAELTSKRHDNIRTDIKKMLAELESDGNDLQISGPRTATAAETMPAVVSDSLKSQGNAWHEVTEQGESGRPKQVFYLNELLANTLVSGYSLKCRYALNHFWLTHRDKEYVLAASLKGMIAEAVAASLKETNARIDTLAETVNNGVKVGYIVRTVGWKAYGNGISFIAYEAAMKGYAVTSYRLWLKGTGQTHVYLESEIAPTLVRFLKDAEELAPGYYYSEIAKVHFQHRI